MNDRIAADIETRSLAHRYALALDQRDVEAISVLFSTGADFGRHGAGPDGARSFYGHIWKRFGRSIHTIGTQVVDLRSPTTASGIVYCRAEQQQLDTGSWHTLQFAYHDDYVLEGGQWRFRARAVRFWYREADGVRSLADGPDALPGSWESWRHFWDATPGSGS